MTERKGKYAAGGLTIAAWWLHHSGDDEAWECSNCRLLWKLDNDYTPKDNGMNYCPKCGAKIEHFVRIIPENENTRGW